MDRIKVALNARPLLSTHAGIASYVRNLGHELLKLGQLDLELFYGFSWSRSLRSEGVPGMDSFKSMGRRFLPWSYAVRQYVQQMAFDRGVNRVDPNLYHEPSFLPFRFAGPTVITVHDLSVLRYPEMHPADRVRNFRKDFPDAVARAARIIVDSEFVGREVIEMFHLEPARVRAIHLGVSSAYRPRPASETAECLLRYGLEKGRYVLAVGTLEPRKNLLQALDAHAALPERARKHAPLVIAGTKGWIADTLKAKLGAAERRGDVRWLGYVPGADLPLLYAAARFLVYPSIYEGFGLPVLEAMASGIPVITSNRASLPEVGGDAAIMLDPHDRDGLRDAMLELTQNEPEVRRRSQLGLAQAARFTWRDCAQKTVAVYREALETTG